MFSHVRNEKVQSSARFVFPFSVEIHTDEKYHLGRKNDAGRVLYIDLKAHTEEYVVMRDESSVELL